MDNAAILSKGSEVYAKKRKRKQEQIERIDFDLNARKDFLTGFHKRKLERKNKAKENALLREREEKLEARKHVREERKRAAEEKLQTIQKLMRGQLSSDEEEDAFDEEEVDGDGETDEAKDNAAMTQYKSPTTVTTVTVIDDFNADEEDTKDATARSSAPTETSSTPVKRPSTSTNPGNKKQKKFRYQTKRERQKDNAKIRSQKRQRGDRAAKSRAKGKGKRR